MHIVPINFKRRSKIWRVLCLLLIERERGIILYLEMRGIKIIIIILHKFLSKGVLIYLFSLTFILRD
jgi:hypothetical protein